MQQTITVRMVREEEMEEVRRLSAICFDYPYVREEKEKEKKPEENRQEKSRDRQYGAYTDKDELMASMVAIPMPFYYEGKTVSGYGIGGVNTYPHHRKKGAIRAMFEKMLRDAYEEGKMLSYLYPFSESFYGKFGYCRMNNSTRYTFALQGIPEKTWMGSFELYREGQEDIMSACREAYKSYASRFNLMVEREEPDWKNLEDAKESVNNHYLYLYRDAAGKPAGYIVFWGRDKNLTCREFIFRDYETLGDMLAFMKGYASDYRNICFHAPSVLRLESMCRDFCAYPCKIERAMNGMVRIINVKDALMRAAYRGSGRIVVCVSDPQLVENSGIFQVEFVDGRAVCVRVDAEEPGQAARVDAEEPGQIPACDIAMDINAFSAAIMGDYDPADLDYLPHVQVYNKTACAQVFYRKPSFINNFF
mgnify:CR=1 FL=1